MSGSKRSCPFGYVEGGRSPGGQAKVLKEDTASIYEATLNKLKLGARAAAGGPHANGNVGITSDPCISMERLTIHSFPSTHHSIDVVGPRRCYVCTSRSSDVVCFHCSRGCCEQCRRRCEGCQEVFCSICCMSNYSERHERSFCFDCNAETPIFNRSDNHSSSPFPSTSSQDEAQSMEF